MLEQELAARQRGPAGARHKGRAMRRGGKTGLKRYRVWIAAVSDWQPRECTDVPPTAVAIEPAEEGTMTSRQAAGYVRAFNRTLLGGRPKVWAIAFPVTTRYQGEPERGERIKDEG
jgi:hypothetical protein